MGFDHQYEVVKDSDDSREGDIIKHEHQHIMKRSKASSWWLILICNILAAGVGAGAMFLCTRGFGLGISQSSGSTAASVANNLAASANLSTDLTLPTPSIDNDPLKEVVTGPNVLPGVVLDCGHSPSEARAKGCVFDVMMQDWVPEPCYDSVLTERYLAMGNWTWYTTGDGNVTLSLEEMRKGEHGSAWMATSYHKAHCVFSWIKIIRALRNDRGISQELLSYDHVLHCSHGALKASEGDEGLGVRAPTNYAKCALYGTWKLDFVPDKHNSTERR